MNKETKNVVWTAAFFSVLALILGWMVYSTHEKATLLEGDISALKTQIAGLKVKASDKVLAEKEQTKKELAAAVNEYVKILPSAALMNQNIIRSKFSQYAQQAGIEVLEVARRAQKRARAPRRGRKRVKKKDFEKFAFSLKIRGSLENLVRFMNAIETDEKFFQIEKFDLRPQLVDNLSTTLQSNVVVTTFQYQVK